MRKLSITAKCSDLCSVKFIDENGNVTKSKEYSYVPEDIGIGGGDYVELDIDMDSGQILDWKPVSSKTIVAAINNA